ncbi:S41 family peptidase [Sinomicrobium sp. M5D2P17]
MIKKIYKAVFVNFRIFGLCAAMCLVVAFSSCSRDDESLTEPGRYSSEDITSYEDLFTVFWTVMDENYNYFYEEKERNNLDWDKVYAEYLPKFKALKTWEREGYSNGEISGDYLAAKSYFEEIVNGIMDQHFYVKVTMPYNKTGSMVSTFYSGKMNEEQPLYYDKGVTRNRMKEKLNNSLELGGRANVLGGYLKSAPDTYYLSLNSFGMYNYSVDLSGESLMFDVDDLEGVVHNMKRSELEENDDLDAIKNEELRKAIRNFTLRVYDSWIEIVTASRSGKLIREIEHFNETEEMSDALVEEAGKMLGTLKNFRSNVLKSDIPDHLHVYMEDEHVRKYTEDFYDRFENFKFAFNYYDFKKNMESIMENAPIYKSLFNPLRRGDISKLILDLRGNGGGAVVDTRFFVERLVTHEGLVGYQRTKEGNGRFNYTPWVPVHTKPHPFGIPNPIPIAILTDKGSGSMSEITTMTLKSQGDKVKSVGDYTAGATAGLGGDDDFNGGLQVKVGGVLDFYMPLMAFKDASGKVIESIGVEPDVYVAPPTEEEIKDMEHNPEHRDRGMEKAIEVISGM